MLIVLSRSEFRQHDMSAVSRGSSCYQFRLASHSSVQIHVIVVIFVMVHCFYLTHRREFFLCSSFDFLVSVSLPVKEGDI